MSHADYLDLGGWNAVCWQCGFKFKASELRQHWQGYYVCSRCFEVRQPQDFVRSVPDVQTPPWTQPRPGPTFRDPYWRQQLLWNSGAISGATGATVLNGGGACYKIGDTLAVTGGTGAPTTLVVTGVTNCVITSVAILDPGNYTTLPVCTPLHINMWGGTYSANTSHITLSGNNLIATQDGAGFPVSTTSTVGISTGIASVNTTVTAIGSAVNVGIALVALSDGVTLGDNSNSYGYLNTGEIRFNGTSTAYGAAFTTGDVIGTSFDATAHTLTFYKNGVSQGIAATGIAGGTWYFPANLGTSAKVVSDFITGVITGCGFTPTGGSGSGAIIALTTAVMQYSRISLPNSHHANETNSYGVPNQVVSDGSSVITNVIGTLLKSSGKNYCEVTLLAPAFGSMRLGLVNPFYVPGDNVVLGADNNSYAYEINTALKWHTSSSAYGIHQLVYGNTVVGMLWDATAGTLQFWYNGQPQGIAFTGVTGAWKFAFTGFSDSVWSSTNFGTTTWTYPPPTGYIGWYGPA